MKKSAKQKYQLRNRYRNGNASEGLIALAVALALSLGPFDLYLFQGARHHNPPRKHNQCVHAVVATTVSAQKAFSSPPQLPIASVYDDVLPRADAEWLHEVCYRWNEDVKKHKTETITTNPNPKDLIFEFPLEHSGNHIPIQRFLNEVIWQMVLREESDMDHKIEFETETEDATNTKRPTPRYYVEYWTRQEWHHILAHQDMDEGWERMLRKQRKDCNERNTELSLEGNADKDDFVDCGGTARKGGNFKHPITGQVLYLKVGSMVKGPTVIFDAANGGNLVAKTPKSESNGNGSASVTTTTTTAMVSVPAVEGRLLRFKGDKLHAVPRPHDVYWTFDQSENHIHTKDYERSVLLFNLWHHSTDLVDKMLDCGDGVFRANRTTCFEDENGGRFAGPPRAASDPTCNPQRDWKQVPLMHKERAPIPQQEQEQKQHELSFFSLLWEWFFGGNSLQQESFQVPLSGDAYKRGISGYVAKMQSFSWWDFTEEKSIHPVRDNLGEAFFPTSIEIEADERHVLEEHLEL